MSKKHLILVISSLLILVSCTNKLETSLTDQAKSHKADTDSLSKKIDFLEKRLAKYQKRGNRSKRRDTIRIKKTRIVEEENIHPAKIVDYKVVREIPKTILDTLRKEYPNFHIPKANRCKAQGRGNLTPEESPFYIWGDFNNDKIIDYAVYIEFYGLNYNGIWIQENRIVILSSKESTNKNKDKYNIFDLGGGRGSGYSLPIYEALVKLSPQKEYSYFDKKFVLNGEKILYLSFGHEVGALLEWDGKEYKLNYLWNTL